MDEWLKPLMMMDEQLMMMDEFTKPIFSNELDVLGITESWNVYS